MPKKIYVLKILFSFSLLFFTILSLNACAKEQFSSQDVYNNIKQFENLPNQIHNSLNSEKVLSILKLEYQIETLPEFVVLRKLQTSILQTIYTAYDIGHVSFCYALLDFEDEIKMKEYYSYFLRLVSLFNDASRETVSLIEKNLETKDHYLEKQYPDFASTLSEIKTDIVSLSSFINNFVKNNIPQNISAYDDIAKTNKIVMQRKRDIALANADYPPPKGFMEHLAKFLMNDQKDKENKQIDNEVRSQ